MTTKFFPQLFLCGLSWTVFYSLVSRQSCLSVVAAALARLKWRNMFKSLRSVPLVNYELAWWEFKNVWHRIKVLAIDANDCIHTYVWGIFFTLNVMTTYVYCWNNTGLYYNIRVNNYHLNVYKYLQYIYIYEILYKKKGKLIFSYSY